MLLLQWATASDKNNVLRQFMRRHVVPLGADGRPAGAFLSANDFDRFDGGRDAAHNEFLAAQARRAGLGALWVDAEWFQPSFPQVGSWRLPVVEMEDPRRFPAGLRAVLTQAREDGLRTIILWTEPERVSNCRNESGDAGAVGTDCAYLAREFPSWILHASPQVEGHNHDSALLNLGDPYARRYMTEFLSGLVDTYSIDVLRFDYNIEPAAYWRAADSALNRSGVTERMYVEALYEMWDELRARHPGLLLDSCASGGRRLDLEVLSRAVVLARSDYEFGSSHLGKCPLPQGNGTMPLYENHTVDYEASQSMTMGSFLHGAVPYGSAMRHYLPYAARSAGPGAKAVDWGLADWESVSANSTEMRMVQQAVVEAALLREYILDPNLYFPLLGEAAGAAPDVWAGYQLHRPDRSDGFALIFRRCLSNDSRVSVQLHALRQKELYTLSFRFQYGEAQRRTVLGANLTTVTIELPRMGSVLVLYSRAAEFS
eukprot:SAG22_NODE_236_length_14254_cov_3.426492_8_plen_486_part_00